MQWSVDHPVTVLIDIVSAFSPKVKIIGLLTATIVLGSALARNSGATGLPPGSPTAAIVVDGKTIELPLEIDDNGVATLDQWIDGEPGQWQATLDLLIDCFNHRLGSSSRHPNGRVARRDICL